MNSGSTEVSWVSQSPPEISRMLAWSAAQGLSLPCASPGYNVSAAWGGHWFTGAKWSKISATDLMTQAFLISPWLLTLIMVLIRWLGKKVWIQNKQLHELCLYHGWLIKIKKIIITCTGIIITNIIIIIVVFIFIILQISSSFLSTFSSSSLTTHTSRPFKDIIWNYSIFVAK